MSHSKLFAILVVCSVLGAALTMSACSNGASGAGTGSNRQTQPPSVALSGTPTAEVGTPFQLFWGSSGVTSCTPSGGTSGDGWNGTRIATSGTATVTERTPGSYTYTITCSGSAGTISASTTTEVTNTGSSSGGSSSGGSSGGSSSGSGGSSGGSGGEAGTSYYLPYGSFNNGNSVAKAFFQASGHAIDDPRRWHEPKTRLSRVATGAPLKTASFTPATSGTQGLFVIPASAPTTPPINVVPELFLPVGVIAQTLSDASGSVQYRVPYGMLYAVPNANPALYRLDLRGTSALRPEPVSSFSGPSLSSCGLYAVQDRTDLTDPASSFFIFVAEDFVQSPQGAGCSADTNAQLVHYSDSAATPPQQTPISSSLSYLSFHDAQGKLIGILSVDSNKELAFYSNTGFSNPKVLLPNAQAFSEVYAAASYAFLRVNFADNGQKLYRVDAAGNISADLYDFQSNGDSASDGIATPDGNNVYFMDNTATFATDDSVSGYTVRLLRVAADGGSQAVAMYTESGGAPLYTSNCKVPPEVLPYGFIGNNLIFSVQAVCDQGAGYPASLYEIAAAASPGTSPQRIASITDGYFGFDVIANGRLFTNVHTFDTSSGFNTGIEAEVLDESAAVLKQLPRSLFHGGVDSLGGSALQPTEFLSSVLIVQGYTATQGKGYDLGGATLERMSVTDLSEIPIKLPDGNNYVLADGEVPDLSYHYADPVGGASSDFSTEFQRDGAALDLVNNVWVRITQTSNLDESPFFH